MKGPAKQAAAPRPVAKLVKIGRSPIRVNVLPPATMPRGARRKLLAEAVRIVVERLAQTGD